MLSGTTAPVISMGSYAYALHGHDGTLLLVPPSPRGPADLHHAPGGRGPVRPPPSLAPRRLQRGGHGHDQLHALLSSGQKRLGVQVQEGLESPAAVHPRRARLAHHESASITAQAARLGRLTHSHLHRGKGREG